MDLLLYNAFWATVSWLHCFVGIWKQNPDLTFSKIILFKANHALSKLEIGRELNGLNFISWLINLRESVS